MELIPPLPGIWWLRLQERRVSSMAGEVEWIYRGDPQEGQSAPLGETPRGEEASVALLLRLLQGSCSVQLYYTLGLHCRASCRRGSVMGMIREARKKVSDASN